ncbi:MAG: IMP dehydrogenase [Chitinivibrionales bacterium]|nr:IMP dehydrogenase [Chitinivibrionales bacterium]
MATILPDISRTFSEYLILPGLTEKKHIPDNVHLATPVAKYKSGETSRLCLNIPFVSSSMQAVSGPRMAIALSRRGALSFIFCSQPIETQTEMITRVKHHKAGFVPSDSNVTPQTTLKDTIALIKKTGHSTVAVTDDGTNKGMFLGILTDKDFWEYEDDLQKTVKHFMTPKDHVVYGFVGMSLHEANSLLHKHKKECLPILDSTGRLDSLVFKKDFFDHMNNPNELVDGKKRLRVGAAINTHDYKTRSAALIAAGVDVLVIDSSDGYSEFQQEAAVWIRKEFGQSAIIGGGNIVSADAFRYLVEFADVDFVKVGIGGGSICITREQKGIGRGQASALLDVVSERNKYLKETGIYVPICSDGGLANDTQIIIALAMGADFVMMGRYFAMTNESPTPKVSMNGRLYKPYWGEGSNRARNWQRYNENTKETVLKFEEGVDAYVPVVGSVSDVLNVTIAKLKATMCNIGALTLQEFSEKAVLTRISEQSFIEGGTPNVIKADQTMTNDV